MNKKNFFLKCAFVSFLLTIFSPILIGMVSTNNDLMWNGFTFFAVASVVCLVLWSVFSDKDQSNR